MGFSSRGNDGEGLVSCVGVVGSEEIPDAVWKEKKSDNVGLGSDKMLIGLISLSVRPEGITDHWKKM